MPQALRFRGNANNANCSPRNWNANNAASNANRNNGGSAKASKEEETVARTRPEAANIKDLKGWRHLTVGVTGKRPTAQPEPDIISYSNY